MADPFLMLFLMLAAHAVGDYSLQPVAMSVAKRGGDPNLPWPLALGGHALIHGAGVAFAVVVSLLPWAGYGPGPEDIGRLAVMLGAAETAAHAAIDWMKAQRWFGMVTDQALHLACKPVWILIVMGAAS